MLFLLTNILKYINDIFNNIGRNIICMKSNIIYLNSNDDDDDDEYNELISFYAYVNVCV